MAPTAGFALAAAPHAPPIPGNVGKLDVKSIYDSVAQGLQTAEALRTQAARQQLTDAALANQRSQALAAQTVLPSAVGAEMATNNQKAALASPAIVAGEQGKTLAGLSADTVEAQNRLGGGAALATVAGALTPQQRVVFDKVGPPTTNTVVAGRDNSGNFLTTDAKTAQVGNTAVPISNSSVTTPSTPVLTPITGANGMPLGSAVTMQGPDGKPTVHIATAPLGALNNINVGTTYQKVGQRRDEQGNLKDVYQAYTTSAAGGAPTPHGAPVETLAGSGPPGTEASQSAATQPFISKMAATAIEDANTEIHALQVRKVELENITNASEDFIKSGATGKFLGPLRELSGSPEAQAFIGSVQNALSTALQPLKGTGRVSNTEFNQALSALPKVGDAAETIRAKLKYLNLVTDWGIARQNAYIEGLGQGLNPYQAGLKARKEAPIPEVADFYGPGGATTSGAYVPPTAAPAPTAPAAPAAPTLAPADQAAVDWARANKGNPKAAAILKANGIQD